MSEAFGGNRAYRGDRPVLKRVSFSLRFRIGKMGSPRRKQIRDSRMPGAAKMHAALGNQPRFPHAARATDTTPAAAKAENRALGQGFLIALYWGCHCTPTTNRASGRLPASICRSGPPPPGEVSRQPFNAPPTSEARSPPPVSIALWTGPCGPSEEFLRER